MTYDKGLKVVITEDTMDNLYNEMRVMRDQLLNRIELLEDEVDYLTQENMQYSRQLYQLESDIDSLLARISNRPTKHERLEYQKTAKKLIKRAKKHPDWYSEQDIYYAKQVKKQLKLEERESTSQTE